MKCLGGMTSLVWLPQSTDHRQGVWILDCGQWGLGVGFHVTVGEFILCALEEWHGLTLWELPVAGALRNQTAGGLNVCLILC